MIEKRTNKTKQKNINKQTKKKKPYHIVVNICL